jgi:hypothetical protein
MPIATRNSEEEGMAIARTGAGARDLSRRKIQQRQHGIAAEDGTPIATRLRQYQQGYANSKTEFRGGGYGNSKNGIAEAS